ncbi:MAG TPA: hypothetical protein VGH87_17845 [Polyangiaceae bacterium]
MGLAAAGLWAPLAHAAGADDKAAAQAMFDEGRKLMEQGKYAEACPKLEASQRLDPGAGTLLNLAACYDKNGQTASAWVTYTDAATASRERHPDWAQRADARVKALQPTLSHLTIDAPTTATVTRDGKPIDAGSFGAAMPVDPGHHVIDATAPNKKPFHQEVDVGSKGAEARVTVKLEDAPVTQQTTTTVNPITSPPPQPEQTSSGSGVRIAGITMIGVGVAGVIVGGIFGGLAIGKKNDASPLCTSDFSKCTTAGKAIVDDALAFGTISTIGFVAGGVLAVGGLIVFLVAPKTRESRVSFSVSPFGASIGGSF